MGPGRIRGFVRRPSRSRVSELAADAFLTLDEHELDEYVDMLDEALRDADRVDELAQPARTLAYTDRDPGRRPDEDEDPFNLFIRTCRVAGAPDGPLAGRTAGVKDTIAVANVPMTHGSRAFLGYVPEYDATAVRRILDAGATIVGKLNQDDYAFSGSSDTSPFGPALNPGHPGYSPGGSSSAAGAAVAAGAVDFALAHDGAGSGRIPAAWTGVYAIKPTLGLVPQFGIVYQDHSLDAIVPVAGSVRLLAEVLAAVAGEDEDDPQWYRGPVRVGDYVGALERGTVRRIGVVRESLGWESSDAAVDDAIRAAVDELGACGVEATEVSVPLWRDALAIWGTFLCHSFTTMMRTDGQGMGHMGYLPPSYAEFFGRMRRARADDFPPAMKLTLMLGAYLRDEYYGVYYAKATNLRRVLRRQIDEALGEVDVLVTPTTPMLPFELAEQPLSPRESATRSISNVLNTVPLNVTGHPALTVPVRPATAGSQLPSGMQLIGKHWDEERLLRLARLCEEVTGQ